MGGLCNLFTGGGLPLRCSPCSHHRKPIIPPEWPELALSREFARRWVGCAIPLRGVDSRCDALPCPHQRKPIIPPEWPELVSSREFVRRWVGCAISLRGVDSCCDALLAHITTSPLYHPNGPNWLGAKNSPEDGWAVQFLYGGWIPAATLSLLTSPQVHYPIRMAEWLELAVQWAVQLYGGWTPAAMLSLFTSPQAHYPTRMARIGFEPEIRPKMGEFLLGEPKSAFCLQRLDDTLNSAINSTYCSWLPSLLDA